MTIEQLRDIALEREREAERDYDSTVGLKVSLNRATKYVAIASGALVLVLFVVSLEKGVR